MHIFAQMNSINPCFLNPVLVVRHCGSSRKKDIMPSMKEMTALVGWIPIIGLYCKIETR